MTLRKSPLIFPLMSSSSLSITPESRGLYFLGKPASIFDLGDGVPVVTLNTNEESCGPAPKNMSSSSKSSPLSDVSLCGNESGEDLGEGDADLT
jgi:hypothetical protein